MSKFSNLEFLAWRWRSSVINVRVGAPESKQKKMVANKNRINSNGKSTVSLQTDKKIEYSILVVY